MDSASDYEYRWIKQEGGGRYRWERDATPGEDPTWSLVSQFIFYSKSRCTVQDTRGGVWAAEYVDRFAGIRFDGVGVKRANPPQTQEETGPSPPESVAPLLHALRGNPPVLALPRKAALALWRERDPEHYLVGQILEAAGRTPSLLVLDATNVDAGIQAVNTSESQPLLPRFLIANGDAPPDAKDRAAAVFLDPDHPLGKSLRRVLQFNWSEFVKRWCAGSLNDVPFEALLDSLARDEVEGAENVSNLAQMLRRGADALGAKLSVGLEVDPHSQTFQFDWRAATVYWPPTTAEREEEARIAAFLGITPPHPASATASVPPPHQEPPSSLPPKRPSRDGSKTSTLGRAPAATRKRRIMVAVMALVVVALVAVIRRIVASPTAPNAPDRNPTHAVTDVPQAALPHPPAGPPPSNILPEMEVLRASATPPPPTSSTVIQGCTEFNDIFRVDRHGTVHIWLCDDNDHGPPARICLSNRPTVCQAVRESGRDLPSTLCARDGTPLILNRDLNRYVVATEAPRTSCRRASYRVTEASDPILVRASDLPPTTSWDSLRLAHLPIVDRLGPWRQAIRSRGSAAFTVVVRGSLPAIAGMERRAACQASHRALQRVVRDLAGGLDAEFDGVPGAGLILGGVVRSCDSVAGEPEHADVSFALVPHIVTSCPCSGENTEAP